MRSFVFEKDIATVAFWREKGVRMAALLWNNENRIGYPAMLAFSITIVFSG